MRNLTPVAEGADSEPEIVTTNDRGHSLWGGSSIRRRLQCVASASLEAKMPEMPQSDAAEAGTRIHDGISAILSKWVPGASLDECIDLAGDMSVHLLDDDDLYVVGYCCGVAISRLNELAFEGEDPQILTELKVELSAHPDFWGYADLVIWYERGFDLFDWKTGRYNVSVRDENGRLNDSLAFYTAGFMNDVRAPLILESITAWIVQPRSGGVEKTEVTIGEIESFVEEISSARELADGDNPPAAAGDWCKFCRATPLCPTLNAHVTEVLVHMYDDPALLDPSNLESILDRAGDIRRWLDDVEGFATHQIQSGQKIGNWQVVPTRPTRCWVNEDAVWLRLRGTNMSLDDYAPRKLVSPAQAEKLIKKEEIDGIDLSDLVEAKSSGVKLQKGE